MAMAATTTTTTTVNDKTIFSQVIQKAGMGDARAQKRSARWITTRGATRDEKRERERSACAC